VDQLRSAGIELWPRYELPQAAQRADPEVLLGEIAALRTAQSSVSAL